VLQAITFRKMTIENIPLLTQWLQTPLVYEFFNGTPSSLEEVRHKYLPRIKEEHPVRPYIFHYRGVPSGYLQYYPVSKEEAAEWGYSEKHTVIGMDCFIGEPSLFNKGIGTSMVSEFMKKIIRLETPTFIVLDPSKTNKRAIRCYEKAGFITKVEVNDGSSLLMEFKCPSHSHPKPVFDKFPDRQSI
jgi:aminoglycoside 6'-N-acetyltransferase